MSLHPTLSEDCLQYSVKKFFNERLKDIDGEKIYFSMMYSNPADEATKIKHDSWVRFHFDGRRGRGVIAEYVLNIYVFSRGRKNVASTSRLLAMLTDKLTNYLVNTDPEGNGLQTIPLYDKVNKEVVSNMVVTLGVESEEERALDNTLYRLVPVRLKFATV